MKQIEQKSFFEEYADEYDAMTEADNRIKYHRHEIGTLINKYNPKTVLDAGCATGLSSFVFAQNEIKTVGLDCSAPMIKVSKEKYGHLSPLLSFKKGVFENLPKSFNGKFDLIGCLANAISGVPNMTQLNQSLKSFARVLAPGGVLILQMLNYKAVKESEMKSIRFSRQSNRLYQRFAERRGSKMTIYINRLDLNLKPPKSELFRHEFDNFTPAQMTSAMKQAGFNKIEKYANLYLDKKYDPKGRDIIFAAHR